LRQIYQEWYRMIAASLPAGDGAVVELGSGAGFLRDFVPGLVTSELFPCGNVDLVLDGTVLPFAAASMRGLVMTDVLHHVPAPRRLFAEAACCVRPEGVLVCIEPWVTPWSQLVYTHLHHEPFCPDAAAWEFPPRGPLSGANGALPWIMFARDRAQFEREFPEWHIDVIDRMMPFRYLVSGGVSLRSFMPGCTFGLWRGVEKLLQPWMDRVAMFARIVLRRTAQRPNLPSHEVKPWR
jgi:SAM-dependent methyltransferase